MKKTKEGKLIHVAYAALAVTILSAFTTIVGYTNSKGVHRTYNLFNFLSDAEGFGAFVFHEYAGKVYVTYDSAYLLLLIALGLAAVVCAFSGLRRLSKQTDNRTSFILTILGLIGTAFPSLVIFIHIVALKHNYLGTISCGIYPVVSPIAMIICIVATTQMRKRNIAYREKLNEVEGLIHRGGDL